MDDDVIAHVLDKVEIYESWSSRVGSEIVSVGARRPLWSVLRHGTCLCVQSLMRDAVMVVLEIMVDCVPG